MTAEGALIPALWDFELANALRSAERRGRISQAGTAQGIAGINALDIERVGPPTNLTRLIDVACERDLSVFDSSYLALALDRGLALMTFDNRLGEAATAAGVHLIK
ncbi:MAG: type II toxin-antitoxin system VapC family toxin [Actinomycetota bacterium]|nr:type II toxin-antitoxin system VapC family toxin [Actinomycetota bacterium]